MNVYELPACLGGWCTQRNHCALHMGDNRRTVVERLCPKGEEYPIEVMRPEQTEPSGAKQ